MKSKIIKMKIKKSTLESICDAARNIYPDEFIALLSSSRKNGIVDELVVLPSTYGKRFAIIRVDLLPFDKSVMGSVHSHPSAYAFPSAGDLHTFKKTGEIHLIIAYPFSFESTKAFDSDGKEIALEAV